MTWKGYEYKKTASNYAHYIYFYSYYIEYAKYTYILSRNVKQNSYF